MGCENYASNTRPSNNRFVKLANHSRSGEQLQATQRCYIQLQEINQKRINNDKRWAMDKTQSIITVLAA